MIWRRVLIPASYTLEELHGVIQVAMGRQSHHLYQFFIRAVHYGSFDLCASSPDRPLTSFRFRKGANFILKTAVGVGWSADCLARPAVVGQLGARRGGERN